MDTVKVTLPFPLPDPASPADVIYNLIPAVQECGTTECPGDESELVRFYGDGPRCSSVLRIHRIIPQSDLVSCIIHLNDGHKWTRERIADWLDTLDLDLRFPVDKVG